MLILVTWILITFSKINGRYESKYGRYPAISSETQNLKFRRHPVPSGTQLLKFLRYPVPSGTQDFVILMGTRLRSHADEMSELPWIRTFRFLNCHAELTYWMFIFHKSYFHNLPYGTEKNLVLLVWIISGNCEFFIIHGLLLKTKEGIFWMVLDKFSVVINPVLYSLKQLLSL